MRRRPSVGSLFQIETCAEENRCYERALRDEGTSYHYLPPEPYSYLRPALREMVSAPWDHSSAPLHIGASWTTDAPFRETEAIIAQRRAEGILAVEMEAAALYALAQARQYQIICFAHVTNQMGQTEGDFEKGEASGSGTALSVVSQTARSWRQRQTEREGRFCGGGHVLYFPGRPHVWREYE